MLIVVTDQNTSFGRLLFILIYDTVQQGFSSTPNIKAINRSQKEIPEKMRDRLAL